MLVVQIAEVKLRHVEVLAKCNLQSQVHIEDVAEEELELLLSTKTPIKKKTRYVGLAEISVEVRISDWGCGRAPKCL
jgi:hypothetical protein